MKPNTSIVFTILVLIIQTSTSLPIDEEYCNKTNLEVAIQNIREHIQKLRTPEILTETILRQVENSFKQFVEKYENFMQKCSEEDKKNLDAVVDFFENITNINQCIISIVKGEMNAAKEAIGQVTDDQLMELMVTVYCANETDCRNMLQFANQLQNPYASTWIYKSLTYMLDNARMNTTLMFINELNDAKQLQTNINVSNAMQKLLRQAIKADLTLEYDYIEEFYKIDSDITFEVVQELIDDNFDGNIGSYAIFQLVQRFPNVSMWITNLEAIFHKLDERQELNSIFGAELVREIKRIERLHDNLSDVDQEKLQKMKHAIPTFVEKLLLGEICCDMLIINNLVPELSNDTRVFISSKYDGEFKRVKVVPKSNGSLVMVDVKMEGSNMTILMDRFDHDGTVTWNNVAVPVTNASMEKLETGEFCKYEKFNQLVCMPAEFILSTITKSPSSTSTLIEKFFEFYHSNKNICPKN